MAFTLPQFNLLANRWTGGNTPNIGPPDITNIPVQLYVNPRIQSDLTTDVTGPFPGFIYFEPPVYLRFPTSTVTPLRLDIFEVVIGSADYYIARWIQKMHRGFTNEYLLVIAEQCDGDGTHPRP